MLKTKFTQNLYDLNRQKAAWKEYDPKKALREQERDKSESDHLQFLNNF